MIYYPSTFCSLSTSLVGHNTALLGRCCIAWQRCSTRAIGTTNVTSLTPVSPRLPRSSLPTTKP